MQSAYGVIWCERDDRQESCAVARKLHDAAAVVFGLKFAGNIHYKFIRVVKPRKPGFRAPNVPAQNRI